jgi:hypothetical protein
MFVPFALGRITVSRQELPSVGRQFADMPSYAA